MASLMLYKCLKKDLTLTERERERVVLIFQDVVLSELRGGYFIINSQSDNGNGDVLNDVK